MRTDPIELTKALVRCASVTPEEGGALELLADVLSQAGFVCARVDRGGIANLFARWGKKGATKSFGFNGHTDVVPEGDETAWRFPPFSAEEAEGHICGRGTTDMKSTDSAYEAAAVDKVKEKSPEGAVIEGEKMDVCLVGEPTCPNTMGEMMKIGRRGSLSAFITMPGVHGHAAYPHLAKNPLPAMARLMDRLSTTELDQGTAHFDPSTLAVVNIDTGNPTTNVIPAS